MASCATPGNAYTLDCSTTSWPIALVGRKKMSSTEVHVCDNATVWISRLCCLSPPLSQADYCRYLCLSFSEHMDIIYIFIH